MIFLVECVVEPFHLEAFIGIGNVTGRQKLCEVDELLESMLVIDWLGFELLLEGVVRIFFLLCVHWSQRSRALGKFSLIL